MAKHSVWKMRNVEWFSNTFDTYKSLRKLSFNALEIREWALDCRKSIMTPTKLWIGMWKSNCPSGLALFENPARWKKSWGKALTIPLFHYYQNFSSKIRMIWADSVCNMM